MNYLLNTVVLVWLMILVGNVASAATFTHPTAGFSVDYDETAWEVAPEKPKGQGTGAEGIETGKTLLNLQRTKADEKYHSRFSVVVEPVGKNAADLQTYQQRSLDFLKAQRFQNPTSQPLTLPNIPEKAYELVGYQRDFGLNFIQVIFQKGENFYLLTTAARSKEFENQKKDLRKILDSFRFNSSAQAKP